MCSEMKQPESSMQGIMLCMTVVRFALPILFFGLTRVCVVRLCVWCHFWYNTCIDILRYSKFSPSFNKEYLFGTD